MEQERRGRGFQRARGEEEKLGGRERT